MSIESRSLSPTIRPFPGLGRTLLGRVVWILMLSFAIGFALAVASPLLGVTHVDFAGSQHFGYPMSFLSHDCIVHGDGKWHIDWGEFFLDVRVLALLAAPLAAAWVSHRVRNLRRWRQGVCLACGYDLRRLPEARCPECGTPLDHVLVQMPPRVENDPVH